MKNYSINDIARLEEVIEKPQETQSAFTVGELFYARMFIQIR